MKKHNASARFVFGDRVSREELWHFYVGNDRCEVGLGFDKSTSVLDGSDVVVAARQNHKLIGVGRASLDAVDAIIWELTVATRFQGPRARYAPVIEDDSFGVAKAILGRLIVGLKKRGALFVQIGSCGASEMGFYAGQGFVVNEGHLPVYADIRDQGAYPEYTW